MGFIGFFTIESEVVSAGTTWYVGSGAGNHTTSIQDAIDNYANPGDTVFVYAGTYNENVLVNKTINLTGENSKTTIIQGDNTGSVVRVIADWVNITRFKLLGSGFKNRKGIELYNVQNCRITDNNISSNAYGVYLDSSSDNIVKGNEDSTSVGIHLEHSDNNNILDNKVRPLEYRFGIYVWYSSNNTLIGNNIAPGGLYIEGDQLSHYNTHNISTSNIINGEPLYYYKDESGIDIDGIPIGQLILANCTDFDVRNLQIHKTPWGIHVAYSTNITIINNNISDNNCGIFLYYSNENKINGNYAEYGLTAVLLTYSSNNEIKDNILFYHEAGVRLYGSSNNTILNNNASYNAWGIDVRSSYNLILGNIALGNTVAGIRLGGPTKQNIVKSNNFSWNNWGIHIWNADDNIIKENTFFSNYMYGIYLYQSSSNNYIKNNNITSNEWGIYLESSSLNRIYHNNISNNTNQAYDEMNNNFWNDTYPSGGNYWSDYTGVDLNGTPSQDVPPPDGIGDTPYVIDFDSQDNYPLMEPFQRSIPPFLPPILYINVSSDRKDVILNWEPQTIQDFDPYLIYRSTDPKNFDFSTVWVNTLIDKEPGESAPIPERTMWNDTNAAFPGNDTNYEEQYYYIIRAFNDRGEVSSTSRTVGKWTKTFPKGVSAFSLPLEPLQNLTIDHCLRDMNARYIRWMHPGLHKWMKHGDGGSNNTQMETGEGYEVKFDNQTNYTFTGMPGAMISYDNDTGFSGFDFYSNAKNLTATIDADGNVTLAWQEPAGIGPGDWYEVYYSNTRGGFFGTLGADYDLAYPPLGFGNDTIAIPGLGASNPGARLYFMVVPFNANGVRGAGTYSIGIWTEEYLTEYDTFGIPLKLYYSLTADWFCDIIPNAVGINYFNYSEQRWCWHSTRMPEGAFDPILEMTNGYQISTSNNTKFTFIGV